jgi:hypothetical protein
MVIFLSPLRANAALVHGQCDLQGYTENGANPMSIIITTDRIIAAQVLDLVTRERSKALSRREWKHRLAGYGYGIRETETGDIVETLPHHVQVCALPSSMTV